MTSPSFTWLLVGLSIVNAIVLQIAWPNFYAAIEKTRNAAEFWVGWAFCVACFIGPIALSFAAGLIFPWRPF